MKYFKIQIGFDKDQYISIDESELAMALRAQINGKVGVFKEGTISGDKIISITPDYAKMMGWNRGYQLTNEDYREIGTKKVEEVKVFLENTKNEQLGIAPIVRPQLSEASKQLTEGMKMK